MAANADVKCPKCSKRVSLTNGNYLTCDGPCSQLYHKSCSGLSGKDLTDLVMNTDKIWFCLKCKNVRNKRRSAAIETSIQLNRQDSASDLELASSQMETTKKKNEIHLLLHLHRHQMERRQEIKPKFQSLISIIF